MRKPYIVSNEYDGCCAIGIYSEFEVLYAEDSSLETKRILDTEWLDIVSECGLYPIITFAHSSKQNKGVFTPAKFAAWLRRKGEKVTATRPAYNPSSGSNITAYFWISTKKFRNKLDKYNKKREDAAYDRNTNTY